MRAILCLILGCAVTVQAAPIKPQHILVTAGVFRGPFTHDAPAVAEESRVDLTSEQYAALNAMRAQHPGARFVFSNGSFALHPADSIRAGLLAEFSKLSLGEQALYKSALEGVRAMLDAGQISEARKIIFLSAVPTDALAAARLRMLALFPEE